MKIRMLTTAAGPLGCAMAGAVVDIDRERAAELIDRGFAVSLEKPAKAAPPPPKPPIIEAAVSPAPVETATAPRQVRRKAWR